jgi:4,5-DOPA dioxygenase extradiol
MNQDNTSNSRMPVLFVGHGSPMYALEENEFTQSWKELGKSMPKPKAIICISAHWETNGSMVTVLPNPTTIHDFGGFPRALYEMQYPALGNPILAHDIQKSTHGASIGLDEKWGFDHGCWCVLKHMYPDADIPVIQLSLDYNKSPQYHYELAQELALYRNNGVLIIGSGNLVHNLRMVAWDKMNSPEYGFDWALQANDIFKRLIIEDNHKELIHYTGLGREVMMAVPSPDHFLPLLYTLALKDKNDSVSFFNDKAVLGSLTMTSVKIG